MDITRIILSKIFRNPEQELMAFDDLSPLEIYEKEKGKFYIKSLAKGNAEKLVYNQEKNIRAPEEIVRQLFLHKLMKHYKYPKERIEIEKIVSFGREQKRADIIVYLRDNITPKILVETKAPNQEHNIQQLKSYLNAEGAPVGVSINGKDQLILYRPYPKEFDDTLDDIPNVNEDVKDVLAKRKTLKDLKQKDLREVITNLQELVLANSGANDFEEIFKLIYAKLFDEKEALKRRSEEVHFRKSPSGNPHETKKIIDDLFEQAKKEWPDVFEKSAKIKLSAEHLSVCVGDFQDIKLFGSNLRIIDEAFEYLVPEVSKQKKGQYFTPRIIIEMCIAMLNPKEKEYIIDTACGSAGFLVHAMQHICKSLPTKERCKEYASRYLFGIDFDEQSAKISRAIMLIAGDGKAHIYKTNSLESDEWPTSFKEELEKLDLITEFSDNYEDNKYNQQHLKYLNFDILLANPPFAGEIKEKKLLSQYELAKKNNGKLQNKASRHVLFIERNIDSVKEGGRLAIVLPKGIFNNISDEYIRKYIMRKSRILAVIGLDDNSFKPHTGTRTSVIFLQKWHNHELDESGHPKIKDYPIFFATSKKPFKDNSGDYIFAKENGEYLKDENGNLKYQSDLDEIAKAFVEWGKKQNLSFLN